MIKPIDRVLKHNADPSAYSALLQIDRAFNNLRIAIHDAKLDNLAELNDALQTLNDLLDASTPAPIPMP